MVLQKSQPRAGFFYARIKPTGWLVSIFKKNVFYQWVLLDAQGVMRQALVDISKTDE